MSAMPHAPNCGCQFRDIACLKLTESEPYGWMKLIDSREVRVQTADGQEIKLYLTHDGRLWMSPVIGVETSRRIEVSPVDVNGITFEIKVHNGETRCNAPTPLTDAERYSLIRFVCRAVWLGARDAEDRRPVGADLVDTINSSGRIKLKNGEQYRVTVQRIDE